MRTGLTVRTAGARPTGDAERVLVLGAADQVVTRRVVDDALREGARDVVVDPLGARLSPGETADALAGRIAQHDPTLVVATGLDAEQVVALVRAAGSGRAVLVDLPAWTLPEAAACGRALRGMGQGLALVVGPAIDGPGGPRPAVGVVAGLIARARAEAGGAHGAPTMARWRTDARPVARVGWSEVDAWLGRGVDPVLIGPEGRPVLVGDRAWVDGELGAWTTGRVLDAVRGMVRERVGWAVFEPITPDLLGVVERVTQVELQRLWRRGALAGDRPEAAFEVRARAAAAQDDGHDGLIVEVRVRPIGRVGQVGVVVRVDG